jgi:lipoprotein signal peptidase
VIVGSQLAVTTAAVVIIDQLSKVLAGWASPHTDGAIVPVLNSGATVGVAGVEFPLMALLAATGLATFGRYAAQSAFRGSVPPWIVGLIVGGALSNLGDRLTVGAVRDFLPTPLVVFNLADLAVVVGLLGFLLEARPRPG